MVMVALMPMTAFLAASISADVMTNALALLATAVILRSALTRNDSIATGEWLAIVAILGLLALSKQIYLLMTFLTFLTPVKRFGGWRKKLVFCLGAIGVATTANFIWMFLVRNTIAVEDWAHPHEQTMFVLSHPLKYAVLLWQNLSYWWDAYLIEFVGRFGWLNVYLPLWICPTYLTVLVAVALVDRGEGRPLQWRERWLLIGVCFATLVLVLTSQYVSYTATAAKIIRGVQGRYFIPLGVITLLIFYNRRLKVSEKIISIAVIVCCTIVLIVAGQTLLNRYFS